MELSIIFSYRKVLGFENLVNMPNVESLRILDNGRYSNSKSKPRKILFKTKYTTIDRKTSFKQSNIAKLLLTDRNHPMVCISRQ